MHAQLLIESATSLKPQLTRTTGRGAYQSQIRWQHRIPPWNISDDEEHPWLLAIAIPINMSDVTNRRPLRVRRAGI